MVGRIWLLCGRRHRGNMDMKRKGFQGALRSDLRRALGPLFWICVLLIAAVHVGAVWLSFLDSNSGSVISLYDEAVNVENYMQNLPYAFCFFIVAIVVLGTCCVELARRQRSGIDMRN